MMLPNRHETQGTDGYRYGFNGMESDDEVKNVEGGHYDFGSRVYDPRIGRFFSTDPREAIYAWQNPYAFAANNPVLFIDVMGEWPGGGWGTFLDGVQIVIDAAGFIPVIGEIADGINVVIDIARAETAEEKAWAIAGATSMIPFVGWGAGAVKISKRARKFWKGITGGKKKLPEVEVGDLYRNKNKTDKHPDLDNSPPTTKDKNGGTVDKKPDRTSDDPLRLDKDGKKIPDPEAEGTKHTQLGKKEGRKGDYKQGENLIKKIKK